MAPYALKFSLSLFRIYSLLVVITTLSTSMHFSAALCHDHERSALLHFKQSLSLSKSASSDSSAYPKTESWKARGENDSDCCSWYGVECHDNTGYVIGLHLSSSLLYGTLRSDIAIFSLVHLQTLNLADNNFKGSLMPPEITHLSSLSNLNLSFSGFSGQIPLELSQLSKLTSLDLSNNHLYGTFPINIFYLPDLLILNVSGNENLTGYFPEVTQTSFIRAIQLSYTNFSGNLPASVGNLRSLTELQLDGCYFSGSIPTSIGNLTELTLLSLAFNMFDEPGNLSWLDKLTKLTLLDLENTNLYGDIPPSLANLTQLSVLSLSQNPFNKSRNLSWLDKLSKLTYLDLENSSLYGYIPPSLANLTQLTSLYLGFNSFTGQIPLWLTNLTQLTSLYLNHNDLTGQIPTSISELINLEEFSVRWNNLDATVEVDSFFSLKKLYFVSLSVNKITFVTHHHINFTSPNLDTLELVFCNLREVPYFLRFLNNLEVLYMKENDIYGKIPHWIWNASDHLEAIDLSINFLTGLEQNHVALSSTTLRVVNISHNILQGELPIPPPNTILYDVSNNKLTGDILPMICGARSLQILDLSKNNMGGPIPQCLSRSLKALILHDNNFSGTIPQRYFKGCELKVINLSGNQLIGEVPKSLSNCKMLQILDLSNNRMEQTFPVWLGTLPQLQVLILHSNKFHGALGSPTIPSEFPMLRIIDLSHNCLTGNLPVDYIKIWNAMKVFSPDVELYINTGVEFKTADIDFTESYPSSITLTNKGVRREYIKILNVFTAIDLSSNNFTGQIPESLGSLQALQSLNLSNNDLTGRIPPSLGKLTQLESLDLSQNKLSGVIPEQLAVQLNFLAFFNVSNNFLSGHIPQGPQFKTFDNNSYMENSGLCGFPLSKNCGTVLSPPDDNEDDSDEDKFPSGFDWLFILVGLGSGLVVGFVMGGILTDKYLWLIFWIFQKFGRAQKKPRMRKRQIIRA